MRAGLGLLVAAAAGIGGYALYKAAEQKQASTAPVPGQPVPVYGPNGAIIGYVTPTGIYPNQAPGGPSYVPPATTSGMVDGMIVTTGCVACGSLDAGDCECESDYRRMRYLTQSVALAGAFR